MKNLKFAILGAGVLGLISAFLPFISFGEASVSFWEIRVLDSGQVYLTLFGFVLPALIAAVAIAKGPAARWHGIVAAVGFLLAFIKLREAFQGAIGAKLMFICALAGMAVAIASIVKPEQSATA